MNKLHAYRLGWLALFLVGNYLYFTGPARSGAASQFARDPMGAFQQYYIGNPIATLSAALLWAGAYFTIKIFFFPGERRQCTAIALTLIVGGLGLSGFAR